MRFLKIDSEEVEICSYHACTLDGGLSRNIPWNYIASGQKFPFYVFLQIKSRTGLQTSPEFLRSDFSGIAVSLMLIGLNYHDFEKKYFEKFVRNFFSFFF